MCCINYHHVVVVIVVTYLQLHQFDGVCGSNSIDPYRILGVHRDASDGQIRRAFKKLALQWHPDKNKDPEAANKFIEIKSAYEILSDQEKRADYDKYGYVRDDYGTSGGGGRGNGGNPFHQFTMNDDLFSFLFQDGFDDDDSNHYSQLINMFQFQNHILPESNYKPYVLEIYSDFCFQCLLIQNAWAAVAKDLESIGVGVGQVDTRRDYALPQFLGVTGLPSVYAIVEGEIFKYNGELTRNSLRSFLHRLLPVDLVAKVTDNSASSFFVRSNRPKILLFSTKSEPSLKFTLLAMEFKDYVTFGMARLGSETEQLRKKFKSHHFDPTVYLFKEDLDIPDKILTANDMKAGALHQLLDDNKYLNLPRLESHNMFLNLCQEDIRLCVILFTTESESNQENIMHLRKTFSEVVFDGNDYNVAVAYVTEKRQKAFVNSFDTSKLPNPSPDCDQEINKIVMLIRTDGDNVIYDWLEGGWCRAPSRRILLQRKISAIASSMEGLNYRTTVSKLVDENAPGSLRQLLSWFKSLKRKIMNPSNFLSIGIMSFFIIPIICILVTLVSLAGSEFNEDNVTHNNKRRGKMKRNTNHEIIIPPLSVDTEKQAIHSAPRGHITMILLLMEESNVKARSSPLYTTFASIMYSYRREFLSMSCYWTSITSQKQWCEQLLGELTDIDDSLHGSVIAINGHRRYFVILKLPSVRNCQTHHNVDSESDGDDDTEDFLGMNDTDRIEPKVRQLEQRLPDWIGRLREGALTRYSVERWPDLVLTEQ